MGRITIAMNAFEKTAIALIFVDEELLLSRYIVSNGRHNIRVFHLIQPPHPLSKLVA